MSDHHRPPPLVGIRILELATASPGPGPFAGLLLADYGASVLRVDRPTPSPFAHPNSDLLTRRKTSIRIDLKSSRGIALIKQLARDVDVLIDPFRPGVLEKLGLAPQTVLLPLNPRLIVARTTGFRRDGKYASMAGHDINYIAVSGVLSLLGRQGETPYAPGNLAGGAATYVMGILLALLSRERSGRGQVVEANSVDGSAMLATMPRLATKTAIWDGERGTNLLDGGAPFYNTYETQDGKFMAVGAIELHFYAALLRGLELSPADLPGNRDDKATWPALRTVFTARFKTRTRAAWEAIFDGTDACCTPVLTQAELQQEGFELRPAVTLWSTPAYAVAEGEDRKSVV